MKSHSIFPIALNAKQPRLTSTPDWLNQMPHDLYDLIFNYLSLSHLLNLRKVYKHFNTQVLRYVMESHHFNIERLLNYWVMHEESLPHVGLNYSAIVQHPATKSSERISALLLINRKQKIYDHLQNESFKNKMGGLVTLFFQHIFEDQSFKAENFNRHPLFFWYKTLPYDYQKEIIDELSNYISLHNRRSMIALHMLPTLIKYSSDVKQPRYERVMLCNIDIINKIVKYLISETHPANYTTALSALIELISLIPITYVEELPLKNVVDLGYIQVLLALSENALSLDLIENIHVLYLKLHQILVHYLLHFLPTELARNTAITQQYLTLYPLIKLTSGNIQQKGGELLFDLVQQLQGNPLAKKNPLTDIMAFLAEELGEAKPIALPFLYSQVKLLIEEFEQNHIQYILDFNQAVGGFTDENLIKTLFAQIENDIAHIIELMIRSNIVYAIDDTTELQLNKSLKKLLNKISSNEIKSNLMKLTISLSETTSKDKPLLSLLCIINNSITDPALSVPYAKIIFDLAALSLRDKHRLPRLQGLRALLINDQFIPRPEEAGQVIDTIGQYKMLTCALDSVTNKPTPFPNRTAHHVFIKYFPFLLPEKIVQIATRPFFNLTRSNQASIINNALQADEIPYTHINQLANLFIQLVLNGQGDAHFTNFASELIDKMSKSNTTHLIAHLIQFCLDQGRVKPSAFNPAGLKLLSAIAVNQSFPLNDRLEITQLLHSQNFCKVLHRALRLKNRIDLGDPTLIFMISMHELNKEIHKKITALNEIIEQYDNLIVGQMVDGGNIENTLVQKQLAINAQNSLFDRLCPINLSLLTACRIKASKAQLPNIEDKFIDIIKSIIQHQNLSLEVLWGAFKTIFDQGITPGIKDIFLTLFSKYEIPAAWLVSLVNEYTYNRFDYETFLPDFLNLIISHDPKVLYGFFHGLGSSEEMIRQKNLDLLNLIFLNGPNSKDNVELLYSSINMLEQSQIYTNAIGRCINSNNFRPNVEIIIFLHRFNFLNDLVPLDTCQKLVEKMLLQLIFQHHDRELNIAQLEMRAKLATIVFTEILVKLPATKRTDIITDCTTYFQNLNMTRLTMHQLTNHITILAALGSVAESNQFLQIINLLQLVIEHASAHPSIQNPLQFTWQLPKLIDCTVRPLLSCYTRALPLENYQLIINAPLARYIESIDPKGYALFIKEYLFKYLTWYKADHPKQIDKLIEFMQAYLLNHKTNEPKLECINMMYAAIDPEQRADFSKKLVSKLYPMLQTNYMAKEILFYLALTQKIQKDALPENQMSLLKILMQCAADNRALTAKRSEDSLPVDIMSVIKTSRESSSNNSASDLKPVVSNSFNSLSLFRSTETQEKTTIATFKPQ